MQVLTRASRWLAATLSSEALITSLSAGAEQFTDFPVQELIGRPITQILSDRSVFEIPIILGAAKEWGYWEGAIIHKAHGGNPMEAHTAVTLLADRNNHNSGFLLISNFDKSGNASEWEDMIRAEVGADLRGFAHELNNPLAVMMGFAQLLILNTSCPGKVRTDIEKLYSELQRVVEVVERLHGYAISLYEKASDRSSADISTRNSA